MIQEILNEHIVIRDFYISRIKKYIWSPVIKVIIWQRRVWKSYILKTVIQDLVHTRQFSSDSIFYINKELPLFDHIKTYDDLKSSFTLFKKTAKHKKIFVGIDEVQEISWWERFVNWLLAEYGDAIEIFITWSNSFLLSWELATYISWRYVEFYVWPLDFEEFCLFKKQKKTEKIFLEYLKYWWLPWIFRMERSDETIFNYLKWVYNTIILKDIVQHNAVKNTNFFEELYKYTLSNIWNIFSAKSITDYLQSQKTKIHTDSVINYLKYAQDAFLLHKVYSVEPDTKKYFEIYNKYYVWDVWLRNSLVWFDLKKDIGKLLENYVFLELKRCWYTLKIWRLKSWKEIDFIAEKNWKIQYFQVCYLLWWEDTIQREYAPLQEIRDNRPKYVVSMNDIDFGVSEGIKHIHVMNLSEVL